MDVFVMGVDHLVARFIVELMMLEGVAKVFLKAYSLPHLAVITDSFSCLYLLKATLCSLSVVGSNFWC